MLLVRGPTLLPNSVPSMGANGPAVGSLRAPALLNVKHMVQNQMTPSYPQFTQAGLEEYQQQQQQVAAAAGGIPTQATAVPDPIQTQFKDQAQPTTVAVTTNGVEQQTVSSPLSLNQTDLDSDTATSQASTQAAASGPKRLHVSNIPFRFREADLRNLLGFGPILDVEIIFNERGSKGFGFVTFANAADADRAREKLNGTVVEGRKIEVNNATPRIIAKKSTEANVASAAALRGAAIARGRLRGVYPAAAAAAVAATAAFRHPTPIPAPATGLPYTSIYQDPYLATAYAAERYQNKVPNAVEAISQRKVNPSTGVTRTTLQPYAAGYATAATRYAIPAIATAATYAAAGGAVLSSYGAREYAADPYLGHSIGPVPGYGAALYRGGYQRFAPY